MIPPKEFQVRLPVVVSNGLVSATDVVGRMLLASYAGNLREIRELVAECPELAYAQYNYTPPIHLAVREGYTPVVAFLLERGAYDPEYRTYPYLDSLVTVARERGHTKILKLLEDFEEKPIKNFEGNNGRIDYRRSDGQRNFQRLVEAGQVESARAILRVHPEFVEDETYFSGEGVLSVPAKNGDHEMLELLLGFGASVPQFLKWAPSYHFRHLATAKLLLSNGMSTETKNWHHSSLLHSMAHSGDIAKVSLLLDHGADIDAIEEECRSTPLGLAVRAGRSEVVRLLLSRGASSNRSAAKWATPLAWARLKGHSEIERLLLTAGAHDC